MKESKWNQRASLKLEIFILGETSEAAAQPLSATLPGFIALSSELRFLLQGELRCLQGILMQQTVPLAWEEFGKQGHRLILLAAWSFCRKVEMAHLKILVLCLFGLPWGKKHVELDSFLLHVLHFHYTKEIEIRGGLSQWAKGQLPWALWWE